MNDIKTKYIPYKQKCGRCQQINAFICEHNTPVRDSLHVISKPDAAKSILQYSKREIMPDELPPYDFLKLNPELAPKSHHSNDSKDKPTVVKEEGCCAKCCCCCVII